MVSLTLLGVCLRKSSIASRSLNTSSMSMPVIGAARPQIFSAASSSAPTPTGGQSESYFDIPLPHTRTIKHTLSGTNDSGPAAPLLGLSKSPSGKHWAVLGRSLLKVVRFRDSDVQIVTDLREKTRLSKNYSLTCVQWGFESVSCLLLETCVSKFEV